MWQAGRRYLRDWVCQAIPFITRKVGSYQSRSSRLRHDREIHEDVKDEAKDAETDDTPHNLCWAPFNEVVVVMSDRRRVVGGRWRFGSGQDRLVCCRVWCMGTVAGMLRALCSWVNVRAMEDGILRDRDLPLQPLLCSSFLWRSSSRMLRV